MNHNRFTKFEYSTQNQPKSSSIEEFCSLLILVVNNPTTSGSYFQSRFSTRFCKTNKQVAHLLAINFKWVSMANERPKHTSI